MRWIVLAVVAWTAFIVAVVIVVGTPLQAPGCAHLVAPPPQCAEAIAAENARVWSTGTLPALVLAAAGYAAILLAGLARARRRAAPPAQP
jgi:hypothetical protein